MNTIKMRFLILTITLLGHLPCAAQDEGVGSVEVDEIRILIQNGDLDLANSALGDARTHQPNSRSLLELSTQLADAYQRANKPEKLRQVNSETLAYLMDMPDSNIIESFPQLRRLLRRSSRDAQNEVELEQVFELYDRAIAVFENSKDRQLYLSNDKLLSQASHGQGESALAKAEFEIREARTQFAENPTDTEARLLLANALQNKSYVDSILGRPFIDSMVEANKVLSDEWILEHADDLRCVDRFLVSRYVFVGIGGEHQPRQTLERIDQVMATIDLLEARTSNPNILRRVNEMRESISLHRNKIEGEVAREDLVGQPFEEIRPNTWINGDDVSLEALRGKVVLIDFWAGWNFGDKTLPFLNRWAEEYQDDGLVVLGVTRYYGLDWDDESQTSRRVLNLPAADEEVALARYARHMGIEHPIALMGVVEGNQLMKDYGILVRYEPYIVIVDRGGNIRKINRFLEEADATKIEMILNSIVNEDR